MTLNAEIPQLRLPWREEFQAGRMGNEIESALRYEVAIWLFKSWHTFWEDSPWLATGCKWVKEGSTSDGLLGDPAKLRGAEIVAHVAGVWRRLDRYCGEHLRVAHAAVINGAEMKELAGPGVPVKKRAADGRARLCAALDVVGEERLRIRWTEHYGLPLPANDNTVVSRKRAG